MADRERELVPDKIQEPDRRMIYGPSICLYIVGYIIYNVSDEIIK